MAIPTMLRLGDLVIHLMEVCDDIDEDDRDAILVRTLVQNPTENKLKSPVLKIKTSGAEVKIFKSLDTQIGANSQNESFHFLPKKPGAWILAAEHIGKQGELGPFPGDFRMKMDMEEIPVISEMSEDVLSDVFEDALAGFGIEESLFNDVKIDEASDPLAAAFAHGLNSSPPPTTENNPVPSSKNVEMDTSPMPNPSANLPMTGPPQGPPMTGPPQGPPMTGPPQGPPMTGPPQGPPMTGPPQGPPMTGPPQGPPMTGPPQGPPMTGPPQGPPMTGPPQGPPMTGPPQGPPMTGPPQGPPMTGPPQGPPMTGPPQGPKSGPKGPPKE